MTVKPNPADGGTITKEKLGELYAEASKVHDCQCKTCGMVFLDIGQPRQVNVEKKIRKVLNDFDRTLTIKNPKDEEYQQIRDAYALVFENIVSQAVATEVENTKERLHTYLKQLVWTDEDIAALDRRVFSLSVPTTVQDTGEENNGKKY